MFKNVLLYSITSSYHSTKIQKSVRELLGSTCFGSHFVIHDTDSCYMNVRMSVLHIPAEGAPFCPFSLPPLSL